jgi:hypothetical protein
MDEKQIRHLIKPGDLLTYSPQSVLGWIIWLKTWHPVAHVEAYVGDGKSIAARAFKGVHFYDVKTDHVNGIFRSRYSLDLQKGLDWFCKEAEGQSYDYKGLLGFNNLVKNGDHSKQFCSELLTRFYRKCEINPVATWEDADEVAPFQLGISEAFDVVWMDWD